MTDPGESQFALLWARIECKLRLPAVVMITSAQADDGTTATAVSLARSLAASGLNTGLAIESAMHDVDTLLGDSHLTVRALPQDPVEGSRRALLTEFVRNARENHEVTVIDGAPLLWAGTSRELASIVDGVVMTVCVGRPPTEYDALVAPTLKQSGANLLGAVAVSREFIDEFHASNHPRWGEVSRVVRPETLVTEPASDIHAYRLSFKRN